MKSRMSSTTQGHVGPRARAPPFRPARIGFTSTGKHIIVIFDEFDDGGYVIIEPVTAYEIDE